MKNISTSTIARTVALIIALINQILTSTGKNPLPWSDTEVYEMVTCIATLVTSAIAWWRNNSFTDSAIEADKVMKALKAEKKEQKTKVE